MRQLLRVAKKTVPAVEWKRTPVLFRATAGLRLLPPAKALALLEEVQLALGAARTADRHHLCVGGDGAMALHNIYSLSPPNT